MKIVFFGTPAFSLPFFQALSQDPSFEIVAAVCETDKPAGRGHRLTSPPIKLAAQEKGREVYQPETLKDKQVQDKLAAYQADVFVVVAYGKLIPKIVLDTPRLGCINVHPSLLPKYRGPSPLPAPIVNGDVETGISIMLLDVGMDTGPVLAVKKIKLDELETLESLEQKVMTQGPALLVATLKNYAAGKIKPIPQDNAQATVTKKLTKDDGHLDWQKSAEQIERRVRAYNPWPGTWSVWERKGQEVRLKILAVKKIHATASVPGKIRLVENKIIVDTVDGQVEILKLQVEGKKLINSGEFILGYADIEGTILK